MKYTVIKEFKRLKEGLKLYKKGSTVDMGVEEANTFLTHGLIKKQVAAKPKPKKKPKKDESKSK